MKLNDAQREALQEMARSTARGSREADQLAVAGYAITGESRFGTWARITDAGRQALNSRPVGVPGSAQADVLLREATAREHTNVAKHARRVPAATSPPAAVQDVGAPYIAPRTRRGP